MILKRTLLLTLLISISFICRAQTIAHINLLVSNNKAFIKSIDLTYNNAAYCIDLAGHIIQNPGSDNNLNVSYYDTFDGQDNIGKLKAIGNIPISYYTQYDGQDNIGKLKSIGNITISYYTQYDGFDNIGKLKSIGSTTITYYDRFDISQPLGTIKSIDGNNPYLNIVNI